MNYFCLTTPQKNIWNLQKYYGDTAIGNQCGAIFYKEKRDIKLLKEAIRIFIEKQSGMRLRFLDKEEPLQYVSGEIEEIQTKIFTSMDEFEKYAQKFAKEPIGLNDKAMYRFVVFQVKDRSGVLVALSHLISDAWTFGIMANQVDAAYRNLAGEKDCELMDGDYAEYIKADNDYLHSDRYAKDKAFWEGKYAGRPEKGVIRLTSGKSDNIEAKRITKHLSDNVENKIDKYCKNHPVTPAVLFETALILYLSRINSDNNFITIGIPVLNRSNVKEKRIAGMFVSTMPLTVEIKKNMTVSELAQQISNEHMNIFRHQKYPYSDILASLREKQNFSGNLYDVMISYQNARTDTSADTKWYSNGYSEVPFTIHIDNRDDNMSHTINVDYQTAIFKDEREVKYIIERLEYILCQITDGEDRDIKNIKILPPTEADKIVEKFNDTYVEYPRGKCVHELFTEQAKRTPDKIALVFEDEKFTYMQLDEMTNSLAHYLREKGVKRNDIVPIIAKRSWHVIVAMIGVMKAGGAYMPVSPEFPSERVKYMFEMANVKIALTYGYSDVLEDVNVEMIALDSIDYLKNTSMMQNKNESDDLCYIIFTSGSTGQPKGVAVRHRNVLNYCCNNGINSVCNRIVSGGRESIVSVTNIVFDIFVTESLLPLVNGLTIYFADDDEVMSQSKLSNLIIKNNIDVIQTTPTKMKSYMLDQNRLDYLSVLKTIVLGGEAMPEELYKNILKYSNANVFNIYGPAETTVWSTNAEVTSSDITIGSPIANTQIYILDKNNSPLPIGVPGELCIAGDGVGGGYLSRPELTAEKFVSNPFATEENHHGKIMYHTGDLACWRSDGEIEYLGRIDTQVKIRGLRIELGEIENVMSGFLGIRLTAVTDKRDENNRQYLVGYYTSEQEIDEKELRSHLSSKLPKYMVPNYFMRLDEMPMTASGKTDRKNLPVPNLTTQEREYAAPETDTEQKLADIWSRLLNIDEIGRTDDFFECGGDSLIAISMLTEIETYFDVEISIKDIMEKPVLKKLAQCIEKAGKKLKIKANNKNTYKLMPQQKALYVTYSKEPFSLTYNMPAKIHVPDEIDINKLKDAITKAAGHHRILFSHIESDGQELIGVYDDVDELMFEQYNENEINKFVRPFDLSKAPLVRVGIAGNEILFDMHHIVADGETLNILLRDIIKEYEGIAVDDERVTYGDYSEFFYKQDMAVHKEYFKEQLKCDFESVVLPVTKNPIEKGFSKVYEIAEDVVSAAKKYARKNNMTDTMIFWASYGILLSKYSGNNSVLSSIVLKNRIYADTKDMAGMFVNTIPAHIDVTGSVSEYMQNIKKQILGLFEHQELPFALIADTVGMKDKSVINTSFVYQADGVKSFTIRGEKIVPEQLATDTSKFDLMMELTPVKDGLRIRMEFDGTKYDESLMDRLIDAYERILGQLDKANLSEIEVISPEEYHKVIEEFNDTYVEYPREKCVHELFTEQAKRTPDKIALVFEDEKFTYKQLDEMTNSLAHYLREKGVKRNDIVPIIAKRSWHVIVAMIGVMKAGGAYMPVDPTYPLDRITYMLNETNSTVALTYGYIGENKNIEFIDLNKIDYGIMNSKITNVNQTKDYCYVLFTSGSTGKPKAVIITHSNLSNFVNVNKYNKYQYDVISNCKNVLADTTFTFDISIFEIYLSLLNGLMVVLSKDMADALYSANIINKYNIDVLHITPTKILMLLQNKKFQKAIANLKVLMIGAETFSNKLYQKISLYTNATIYNGYGPTETTIGCSFKKIHERCNIMSEFSCSIDITIGSPIANTQIYILDKNNSPLPIGVPGELCIAGDGVGGGYLNRPELTAEKFVANPFATEENHHGKIMYHTGDLACWRADGEIEYLGRIDTQVKIRGLRIELGEIENVMSGFPGIRLTAVTDKRDENNRQYLVGYYTSGQEVDEKELRIQLSSKLPKYMVPNYFMRLDEMPMTASGKTDRKNLPVPDLTTQEREYAAPETDTEQKLCELLKLLLHMNKVGVEDDFFEYGGDSLTAIEYVAKAHDMGIDFSLQNVFDYPTVKELCNFLNGTRKSEKVKYEKSELDKYNEILGRNIADASAQFHKKTLGNILITGATGFLGAHVVDELMKEEQGKIYCLVRGKNDNAGRDRLRSVLEYYFRDKYESEINRRIVPVCGDIEEPLPDGLPSDVQTVIHTAASVKHYGSYSYFQRVNVEGTGHVVEYAKRIGAKLIHISTLSVSGNSMADDFTVYHSEEEKFFNETSFYIGQPLDNVYIHSKFEAERKVYDAMLEGLDAIVIRVGNLTNRASDYRFQPNFRENAFLTRVKAVLEFGLFPDYLMSLYSEFSPIDKTAEGIVKIAQYADNQSVFHLNSNKVIYFDRFLDIVHELGISMKVVSKKEFNEALQNTVKQRNTEYIYEAFQNDMDENGCLIYDSNIRIENDFTLWFLKKAGFEWNETDIDYIRGYIDYFRRIGYLEV